MSLHASYPPHFRDDSTKSYDAPSRLWVQEGAGHNKKTSQTSNSDHGAGPSKVALSFATGTIQNASTSLRWAMTSRSALDFALKTLFVTSHATTFVRSLTTHEWGYSIQCTNGFGLALAKARENKEAVRVTFWPLFVLDRRGSDRASRLC